MKKLIFLFFLLSFDGIAQQQFKLLTLQKPFTAFRRGGSSSVYSKSSSGPTTNSLTPRVSMKQTESGVVIKTDYQAYKFDLMGKKIWEVKLPDVFGLNDMPSEVIISGDDFTYFWENGDNPIKKFKASVVQIDPKGSMSENIYELDLKNKPYDLYTINGNLCVLSSYVNKKADAIENILHVIDKKDHKVATKKVSLPFDSYEYDKAKAEKGNHYWNWLATQGNNAIFYKAYFKDIEGEKKKKKMIVQLLEMDDKGEIKNNKEIFFEPELAGDDRKFFAPTILFNPKSNNITIVGYLEIDKNKVNGLYLLKYDYQTAAQTAKKEFPFSTLLKPEIKPSIKTHYQIPDNSITRGTFRITSDDLLLDQSNDFLSVRVITDYDLNSSSFFDVKFDKYGDHVQTGVSEFPGIVGYLRNVITQPTIYQLVWKDKTRPYVTNSKQGAWDFVNGSATGSKDKDIFWIALSYTDKNAVIKFNQETGQFFLIVLN